MYERYALVHSVETHGHARSQVGIVLILLGLKPVGSSCFPGMVPGKQLLLPSGLQDNTPRRGHFHVPSTKWGHFRGPAHQSISHADGRWFDPSPAAVR